MSYYIRMTGKKSDVRAALAATPDTQTDPAIRDLLVSRIDASPEIDHNDGIDIEAFGHAGGDDQIKIRRFITTVAPIIEVAPPALPILAAPEPAPTVAAPDAPAAVATEEPAPSGSALAPAPIASAVVALIMLLCLLFSGGQASAQTNAVPTTPATFFTSVSQYFASFDTNKTTFAKTNECDFWAGADYVSGVNISSSLGLEYQLWKKVSVESVTRNAGIAGTILSQQIGVGLNATLYDVKITGYLDGGYDFLHKQPYAALGARVKKALTQNTFAGLGLEAQVMKHGSSTPTISIFTGFTF